MKLFFSDTFPKWCLHKFGFAVKMKLARPQRAITGIMVIIVVSIIVVAVGVGSFVALGQSKNSNSTVSSTIVPETSTSSATSSSTSSPSSATTPSSSSISSSMSITTNQPTTKSATTSQSSTSSMASSTSSQIAETSTTSITSSILSTITSVTAISCSTSMNYNGSGLTNILTSTFPSYLVKDLVGNFSHMAVRFSTSSSVNDSSLGNSSVNANQLILGSYSSLGTKVINGTNFTLVSFTDDIGLNASGVGNQSTFENETGTIYFNPSWNATLITVMGFNITGSVATQLGGDLLIFFELPFVYTTLETSLMGTNYEALHEINQSTATFGNVTMNVTNYNFTSSTANSTMFSTSSTASTSSGCPGNSVSQVNATGYGTLQMGKLPDSNTTILTMLSYYSSSPGLLASTGMFQVESLTLAPQTTSTSTQSSSTTTRTTTMTTI